LRTPRPGECWALPRGAQLQGGHDGREHNEPAGTISWSGSRGRGCARGRGRRLSRIGERERSWSDRELADHPPGRPAGQRDQDHGYRQLRRGGCPPQQRHLPSRHTRRGNMGRVRAMAGSKGRSGTVRMAQTVPANPGSQPRSRSGVGCAKTRSRGPTGSRSRTPQALRSPRGRAHSPATGPRLSSVSL